MICLLIVEDEQVIRNGIKKLVSWKQLGVDSVEVAENAKKALKICENYRPDIIVSDIKMPGMNGVELCRCFRERLPECQIIFVSGYADKEYLKAAITLGAIRYVEKPVDIAELSGAVKLAVEAVHRTVRQQDNFLHELLWQAGQGKKVAEICEQMQGTGSICGDKSFCILILKQQQIDRSLQQLTQEWKERAEQELAGKSIHFMVDHTLDNEAVMLLAAREGIFGEKKGSKAAFCEALLSLRLEQENWFLAAGEEVDSLEKVLLSYQSAQFALQTLSYKGWNSYALDAERAKEYHESITAREKNVFLNELKGNRITKAKQVLEAWSKRLIEEKAALSFSVRNSFFTWNNLIMQADQTFYMDQSNKDGAQHRFLDEAQTIQEMYDYVCDHMEAVCSDMEEEQKSSFLVKKVIEHMNKNLQCRDLSIRQLAEEVYLTPTYLSALFKKTTGITIGQYLTDIRMERAKELLASPQLKLYQVAELVGYEDANYFTKLFKKKTGMLPSEYRDNHML